MIEWHDVVRGLAFLINLYALYLAVKRYAKGHKNWNEKTIDLWYALTMWTLAGIVFCVQGIILDRPFTAGFVFLVAATMVTGKGLHAEGPWGADRA